MTMTGLYRGVVTELDSSPLSRLRVSVPVITGKNTMWAFPCMPRPGLALKDLDVRLGDGVWIMFEGGDLAYPVWVGFYGTRTV